MSENTPCLKGHVNFARFILVISALFIIGPLVASIFATDLYGTVCICIINYLAYAWIAFAVAILFSLIAQVTAVTAMAGDKCKKLLLPNLLMWLQAVSFVAGMVLILIFINRFTNVL